MSVDTSSFSPVIFDHDGEKSTAEGWCYDGVYNNLLLGTARLDGQSVTNLLSDRDRPSNPRVPLLFPFPFRAVPRKGMEREGTNLAANNFLRPRFVPGFFLPVLSIACQ